MRRFSCRENINSENIWIIEVNFFKQITCPSEFPSEIESQSPIIQKPIGERFYSKYRLFYLWRAYENNERPQGIPNVHSLPTFQWLKVHTITAVPQCIPVLFSGNVFTKTALINLFSLDKFKINLKNNWIEI